MEVRGAQLANLDNCEHGLRLMRSVILKRDLHSDLITSSDTTISTNIDGDSSNDESRLKSSSFSSPPLPPPPSSPSQARPSPSSPPLSSSSSSSSSNVDADINHLSDIQITFDHSRCSDCSYGYIKACDCVSLLNALGRHDLMMYLLLK